MKTVYLAGPMRGYPKFNFEAFAAAEKDLLEKGYSVLNPHKMDIEAGFDPHAEHEIGENGVPEGFCIKECIKRDIDAIMQADEVVFLPGWEKSKGATAERAVAEWRGIPCLKYPELTPIGNGKEDILAEAFRITSTDRNNTYGPPGQDFTRTAKMWEAILETEVDATDVALCLIALKLSRATWSTKRDNFVDIAGYARCAALINDL